MRVLFPFVALALGLIVWTFLEYALHRFAGHLPRGRGRLSREHLAHHTDPDYFTSLSKKLALAIPILGAMAALGGALLGLPIGLPFAIGFAAGWSIYEYVHRTLHAEAPRSAYGRWARRHHFHHHYGRPFSNHGVTTSLWDHAFGTLERPSRISVPRRHAHKLPWMLAAGSETEVAEAYASDYRVV